MSTLERFKKIETLKEELISLGTEHSSLLTQTRQNLLDSTKIRIINFLKEQGFEIKQEQTGQIIAKFAKMALTILFDNQDYIGVWAVIKVTYIGPNQKILPFEISIYRANLGSKGSVITHSNSKPDELMKLESQVQEFKEAIQSYKTPDFVFDLAPSSNSSSRKNEPLAKDVKDIVDILTILLNATTY